MKKILTILLVLLMLSAAGCVSKEDDQVAGTEQEDNQDIVNNADNIHEDGQERQSAVPIRDEDARYEQPILIDAEEISPEIASMKIYTEIPDVGVENMVLIDNRGNPDSTQWTIRGQIKNYGDTPAYVLVYCGNHYWNDPNNRYSGYYLFMKPGESVWMNGTIVQTSEYSLAEGRLPEYHINGKRTVQPAIDEEFEEFRTINVAEYYFEPEVAKFVDVLSIRYQVDDAEHGFDSAVLELKGSDVMDLEADVRLLSDYNSPISQVDNVKIPAGEIVKVPLPLNKVKAEYVGGVEIDCATK